MDRIGFDLTTFDNPKENKQSQVISSSTTSTTTSDHSGFRVKTLSEAEGYSWVPMVIFFYSFLNFFLRKNIVQAFNFKSKETLKKLNCDVALSRKFVAS